MTVPRDSDSGRWVDGDLESGADDPATTPAAGQAPGRGEPAPSGQGGADGAGPDGTGAEIGMGEPNSFEPEEAG